MIEFPATVRTTIQPETDIQVSAQEYQELKAQGLLLPGHDGEYKGEVPKPRAARTTSDTKEG